MIADTTAELLAMVDAIKVQRKWIQDAGTATEHFDIAMSKRALAIERGAVPITMKEVGLKIREKRLAAIPSTPHAAVAR